MSKVDIKVELTKILSDGEFHSGEDLGKRFNVSRAAIANHIKSLIDLGLDIYSVTGRGYKLSKNITLLDSTAIEQLISDNNLTVETHAIIDSTNEHLLTQIRNNKQLQNGHSVIAECQLAGRGRRGRVWQSPFGSHIYFSQYRVIEDGLSAAAGLSLAVGLAVQKTCQKYTNSKINLKWPNDILCDGKKLAGILIEAEGQSDGLCHLIIGIGVNIDMPQKAGDEIDQPWVDMVTLAQDSLDRNEFIALLINELELVVAEYNQSRLDNLYLEWNSHNAFMDEGVIISSNTKVKDGICKGIDSSGALLIENYETKKIEKIYGGEVSLRKAT